MFDEECEEIARWKLAFFFRHGQVRGKLNILMGEFYGSIFVRFEINFCVINFKCFVVKCFRNEESER